MSSLSLCSVSTLSLFASIIDLDCCRHMLITWRAITNITLTFHGGQPGHSSFNASNEYLLIANLLGWSTRCIFRRSWGANGSCKHSFPFTVLAFVSICGLHLFNVDVRTQMSQVCLGFGFHFMSVFGLMYDILDVFSMKHVLLPDFALVHLCFEIVEVLGLLIRTFYLKVLLYIKVLFGPLGIFMDLLLMQMFIKSFYLVSQIV